MKFTFRLDKMLHFFALKETTKKMEIAALVQKLSFLMSRKDRLQENIHQLLARIPRETDLNLVPYQGNKVSVDIKELKVTEGDIQQCQEDLDMRRAELLNIARRKKALEALKERKALEFRTQMARQEQKDLDATYQITSKFREQ